MVRSSLNIPAIRYAAKRILTISLVSGYCSLGYAQEADFSLDHLHLLSHLRTAYQQTPPDAHIDLYCDGEYLTLVAEVTDDQIQIDASSEMTDHLEVWFSIPSSSYPDDFEYNKHPDYVYAPMISRGDLPTRGRLFSIYSEYTEWLEIESFQSDFDYPTDEQILIDSLLVPSPGQLMLTQIPFGIVGFALFPDQRPAELLFPDMYQELEHMLGFRLADWSEAIQYTAERDEQGPGYIINAQISPVALGFLPLPDLREIGIQIDLKDKGLNEEEVSVIRSSNPNRTSIRPATFERAFFEIPLYTNFSGVSDVFFYQEDWDGMLVKGEFDWHMVSVEVDALVYQWEKTSRYLMEVSFQPLAWIHQTTERYQEMVEEFRFQKDFINQKSEFQHHLLIDNQLFRTQHIPYFPPNFTDSMFVFPDIIPGIILHGFRPLSPFGWGDCPDCVEETYQIYRIESTQSTEILRISQSVESPYYCEIGDVLSYPDYFIESFDWIYPGEVLVFRLNHRFEPKEKKRVKVSWNEDGSDMVIEEQ